MPSAKNLSSSALLKSMCLRVRFGLSKPRSMIRYIDGADSPPRYRRASSNLYAPRATRAALMASLRWAAFRAATSAMCFLSVKYLLSAPFALLWRVVVGAILLFLCMFRVCRLFSVATRTANRCTTTRIASRAGAEPCKAQCIAHHPPNLAITA